MKPFDSSKAIARASPNAKAAVVDEVGARSKGHASFDLITMPISDALAIVDFLLLVARCRPRVSWCSRVVDQSCVDAARGGVDYEIICLLVLLARCLHP